MSDWRVSVDVDGAVSGFDANLTAARAGLRSVTDILGQDLVALAREKAGGDVLQVRSGAYLRSIRGDVAIDGESIGMIVSSDAPGAGMLEYGGVIPAREILPDVASALRFMGGGAAAIYAASVQMPAVTIAPHPVIHAALDAMRARIVDGLTQAGLDPWV